MIQQSPVETSGSYDTTRFFEALEQKDEHVLEELAILAGYQRRMDPPAALSNRWSGRNSHHACTLERDLYERLSSYSSGFTRTKPVGKQNYFVDCCYREGEFLFAAGVFPKQGDAHYLIGLDRVMNKLVHLEKVRQNQPFLSIKDVFFGNTIQGYITRLALTVAPGVIVGVRDESVLNGIGMSGAAALLILALSGMYKIESGRARWREKSVFAGEEAITSLLLQTQH